ncbi:hypothetical protein K9U40_10230 [Xanthobacter autotrophicus]|uniref:hypothetical protein n=1 Tax=Xanthobacter TaxID=279 RepID=UPI0024AA3151|nr:hypothetical protein [Xanthobacter autotrophicus]MDI4664702.1 hypothetical protein [Xanthobacter autotrophicus]
MRSPTPQVLPALSSLDDLFPVRLLPADHDPLADGILMAHQVAWIEDRSILKLGAKGRRTGITYGEALDNTLIAAASLSAGGDNVFYIPDVKDKGIEYIRYVGHFARVVSKELGTIQEFLFEDRLPNGDSRKITAWRVQFLSGFRVVALASRPANIRGLQGVVVIDEAAFHADVAAVIDAVNALLIWGGRIRIISSHNGEENAFNTLIKDTRAGLYDYSIHHIPFSLAVKNGLYERVCLMRGWTPTQAGRQAWLNTVLRSYGPRHEARDEELEAIPRKSSGVYLPRALVQKAQRQGIPIVPWSVSETFYLDDERMAVGKRWFAEHVRPLLAALDSSKRHVLGQDFARDGDLSVIVVAEEGLGDVWSVAFQIELRRVPFDVQRYILFEILDLLTRWLAKLDARGNGQSHAEAAQQKFGVDRVECVMATAQWYALHFPEYRAALEDGTWLLPMGEDVIADHRLVVLRNGFPAMSDQHVKGQDGEFRHGDSAIAGLLAHAATDSEPMEYGYRPAARPAASTEGGLDRDGFWRPARDDRPRHSLLPRFRGGL